MSAGKKLFCFGYGYTCEYLGHELSQRTNPSWRIAGTTRDPQRKTALRARGIEIHTFDYHHPLADPATALEGTTHLLISTPPDESGDPAFLMHARNIAETKGIEWVGYLSSISVYGDRGGEWVDENDKIAPSASRGSKRARAEEQWLSQLHAHGLPVHIFRIAGIYGPGRSALDSIRAGTARRIDKPGQAFSRIHVEDIVNVLTASFDKPNPGRIYNLCDDLPAPSHEVIADACELLGRPVPPLIPYSEADLAPIARSFYADNKKIRNTRIKEELSVTLKYPTYKEGLRGCLEAEQYTRSIFGLGTGTL